MIILKLINPKLLPKDEEFLWRYIDIHKFLNLLNQKKLRFTRMDQFEDTLEGVPFESLTRLLGYENPLLELSKSIINYESYKKLSLGLYGRLDEIINIQSTQFVSCWFKEQRESLAMWNLYSNPDGVAIRIPFGKLKSELIPNSSEKNIIEYFCGKVNYQNFISIDPYLKNSLSEIDKVSLRKDVSFSHEKEIRFVIKAKNDKQVKTGIDSNVINLQNLGLQVVCHPKMADWKKMNIKLALKKVKLESSFFESEMRLRY